MFESLIYILLAAAGLGFLVFIHELGHYFMARWTGMKVETFSIGFGKAVFSWDWSGTHWQIGWLPFGGYVKIAGMEMGGEEDPYEVEGGYYSKTPFQRIQVALMGPVANFLFAIAVFCLLWSFGGRVKDFSEHTPKLGWVDSSSPLYKEGIRPGDELIAYAGHPYQSVKDHLYAPMTTNGELLVEGYRVDYQNGGEKSPFQYRIAPYQHPQAPDSGLLTVGVMSPASYLIFSPPEGGTLEQVLPKGSTLGMSGIVPQDRLVWADGEQIFSLLHLSHILNDDRALLTIKRGGQRILRRVPRVKMTTLRLPSTIKEEFVDWQHEAGLTELKIDELYAIPYNLTPRGVIEEKLSFIDPEDEEKAFPSNLFSINEKALLPGDRILAVDGEQVQFSYEIFSKLQQRNVHLIVERDPGLMTLQPWKQADQTFDHEVNWSDIQAIASSIGTGELRKQAGDFFLLEPVTPRKREAFLAALADGGTIAEELKNREEQIESIDDPELRTQAQKHFQSYLEQKIIGLPYLQDRKVKYNPNPITQFDQVFSEVWRTLAALFSGALHPKWISGPIGIVQVVHKSWQESGFEVLFWLAVISLNLGVLNLLPIPVLDGGYICLFLVEMVTRRRIQPKTMEKLIIPFVILVVGFILYVTYNDLIRLVQSLISG